MQVLDALRNGDGGSWGRVKLIFRNGRERDMKKAEVAVGIKGAARLRRRVDGPVAKAVAGRVRKAVTVKNEAKPPKAPKAPKEKRMSGLDMVAQVLKDAGEPLDAKTMTERAIAKGWKTNGKTPAATVYAAIIREIAVKGKEARFTKVAKGHFDLAK